MLLLILAQVAADAPPDIEFHAVIDAKSVRIEKQGEARLTLWADPDAGSRVNVQAPTANGAKTMRDVRIIIDGQARIGTGAQINATAGQVPASATEPQTPR